MCVVRQTGLSRWQLLQYELRGLIGPVRRTEAGPTGHRLYSKEQVALLVQIAGWRRAGLQVREIKSLLARDRSATAKHLARRKKELDLVIGVVDALQRALDAPEETELPAGGCSGGRAWVPA